MTLHQDSDTPRTFHSLSSQAVQTLVRSFRPILRAAALPFLVSVAAVTTARLMDGSGRYALDAVHGLMVLSYLTSVARIARGNDQGLTVLGLAVPRFSMADWPGVLPLMGMFAEAVLLILPAALILFLLAINIGPFFMFIESQILSVAAIIAPAFVLNTLLGLVIGAGMARPALER
ncbi:MAG: hypothetical protein JKY27_04705 [Magnetovibrio sp.]|nr:hypothetical protein [Magnetovibrio sp.]